MSGRGCQGCPRRAILEAFERTAVPEGVEHTVGYITASMNIGIKISDISPIYRIYVMFDMISGINNHLRGKLAKKSVILAIYHRYISFGSYNMEILGLWHTCV